LNVSDLKKALSKLGIDYSECVEKEDLVRKLRSSGYSHNVNKESPAVFEKKEISKRIAGIECEVLSNNSQPDFVVFIFHGYGANAEDLKSLAQVFLENMKDTRKVKFILPEGLISLGPQQSCWWPIDINKVLVAMQTKDFSMLENEPFGMQDVRNKIQNLVKEVVAECKNFNVNFSISKNVIFAGFSQGAMLSVDLALHLPEPPKALVVFSGGVCCKSLWEKNAHKLKGIPILQTHGTQDKLLPFELGKILQSILVKGGANVSFTEFNGPHTIPEKVVMEYVSFLRKNTKFK